MREAFNEIVLCVALCGFVAVLLARAACSRAAREAFSFWRSRARALPFLHDDYGQDAEWVTANLG